MLKDFTREKFDVIIQAGQSNSEGSGYGDADSPYVPDSDIWYLKADGTICVASEMVEGNMIRGDYSLSFAEEYKKNGRLAGGRKILIVRASVGATGFSDNRWKREGDLYQNMLAMVKTALSLNPQNHAVAFLWHQGETDALLNASQERHFRHLKDLLEGVRGAIGNLRLPVVMGDFVPQWRKAFASRSEPVEAAMRCACKEFPPAAFVETDGLLSNAQKNGSDDIIHFCRDSLNKLGKRYFAAFAELVRR